MPLHLQELVAAIDELGGGVLDATLAVLTVGHVAHGHSLRSRHAEVIAHGKAAQAYQHIGIGGQQFGGGIVGTLVTGLTHEGVGGYLGGGVALGAQAVDVCRGAGDGCKGGLGGKGLLQLGVEGQIKGEGGFHVGVPKFREIHYVLETWSVLEQNTEHKGSCIERCRMVMLRGRGCLKSERKSSVFLRQKTPLRGKWEHYNARLVSGQPENSYQ